MIPVPNWYPMLRGDNRYNPRVAGMYVRAWDGANVITGVMKPDSPEGVKADPPLPDLPFRFIIPADGLTVGDWHAINTKIFYRIQRKQSLIDLDFTYRPAAPPQAAPSSNRLLTFAAICIGAIVLGGILSGD